MEEILHQEKLNISAIAKDDGRTSKTRIRSIEANQCGHAPYFTWNAACKLVNVTIISIWIPYHSILPVLCNVGRVILTT